MVRCGKKFLYLVNTAVFVAVASAFSQQIAIDRTQKFQTIDGFGFFGPADVWWASTSAGHFYSKTWLDCAIDTMGITIWRNEYYSELGNDPSNQDATWAKQKPAVQALKAKADESGVPLKFIFSVWSPPSSYKCVGSDSCWGTPETASWPQGLKGGGTLCGASQTGFGDWLVAGIKQYADIGINLYAISLQNEPLFCESYNSCFYDYDYYATVLAAVGPIVKAAYPDVKFLGAEDMLSANLDNGKSQFQWIYNAAMIKNGAAQYIGVWAYHGYSDGVNPSPATSMAQCWQVVRDSLASTKKPIWQTEISGYTDSWGASVKSGAMEYWSGIHAGLYYGNMSAWLYWYGAGDLINGTTITKRGCVHRHFARFVRPGAVRISAAVSESPSLFATAYQDTVKGTFVIEAMNTGAAATVSITGPSVPSQLTMYQTTSSDNCRNMGAVSSSGVPFPAQSVVTLVSGNVYDTPAATVPRSREARSAARPASEFAKTARYSIDGRRVHGPVTKSGVYITVIKTLDGRASMSKLSVW